MDTCYGCMYQFGSKPEWEAKANSDNACAPGEQIAVSEKAYDCLLGRFLVEFDSFLRQFLLDAQIKV